MANIFDQFDTQAPAAPPVAAPNVFDQFDAAPTAPVAPLKAGLEGARTGLDVLRRHPLTTLPGAIENGISGVTSGFGAVADALTGADPGSHDWAYRPRTEAGQELANLQARAGASIGQQFDKIAGEGPLAATLKERVPQAVSAAGTVAGLRVGVPNAVSTVRGGANVVRNVARTARGEPTIPVVAPGTASAISPATTAEEVLRRQAAASPENMGAAASAADIAGSTPQLKTAIVQAARKTGGAVPADAVKRHIDADLVFKGRARLTEGQALEDVHLLSEEQNLRGKIQRLGTNFDDQNKAFGQYMQEMRDEVGPDVFSANHVEHGDALIGRYRAIDDARNADIDKAYDDLRAAAGGQFPVDAQALLRDATAKLHKELIVDHAPKSVMNALNRFAASPGSMTFENFEALRTNLATIQRTATDGLEKRAAGRIRAAMEELPLSAEAAQLKPLADKARALARARHQALEADPAYEAAVNDKVPPDRFVQKFITGGTRDNIAKLADAMAGDETARQTAAVSVLDFLRDNAKLNSEYKGNFASDRFDKALSKLDPSLRSLVSPKTVEDLERLSRVAKYTTYQPKGSYVNNSNTFTSAAAEGAKSAAEGVVNFHAGGLPVGTVLRKGVDKLTTKRRADRALAPGAGLTKLKELGKEP